MAGALRETSFAGHSNLRQWGSQCSGWTALSATSTEPWRSDSGAPGTLCWARHFGQPRQHLVGQPLAPVLPLLTEQFAKLLDCEGGLKQLIKFDARLQVPAEAENGAQVLEQLRTGNSTCCWTRPARAWALPW